MPTVVSSVEGQNCAQAWARGVLAIRNNHGPLSPLITTISYPCDLEKAWLYNLSPQRVLPTADSLHSVMEMVGPVELATPRPNRAATYQRVWRKYDRARAMGRHLSNWHDTYFERLTRGANGQNRLEVIIEKMNSWNARRVACFYAHTTSNAQDSVVPIGNPCLQYVQFLQRPQNKLDLVVLYRNHDFFSKALGNYLGLGRLLAFVTRETLQEPGTLTCVSVNAYLDHQVRVERLARTVL
jgi:hypothetical protein